MFLQTAHYPEAFLQGQELEEGRWSIQVNADTELEVVVQSDGFAKVTEGETLLFQGRYSVIPTELGSQVWLEGHCISVIPRVYLPGRSGSSEENSKDVKAPLNGSVFKAYYTEPTTVQAGETLFIIEAMKMENEVKAHREGLFIPEKYQVGDVIEAGDLLGIIHDPDEEVAS